MTLLNDMDRTGPVIRRADTVSPHTPDFDLLRLYLIEIGQHSRLTQEEEVELGQAMERGAHAKAVLASGEGLPTGRRAELERLVEAGSQARARFVLANLRLVVSLAKQHRGIRQSVLDAIGDGNVGLMKAVDRYDWRAGFRFSTHAAWLIRDAITCGGARLDRTLAMSASTDRQVRSLHRSRSQLEQDLGRPPTVDELAAETGMSHRLVVRYLALGVPALSLDAPAADGSGRSAHDVVADACQEPLADLSAGLMAEEVRGILAKLQPRERRMLQLRFGLEGFTPHTYVEAAGLLGLSPERVRQIEHRVLTRLRRTRQGVDAAALIAS